MGTGAPEHFFKEFYGKEKPRRSVGHQEVVGEGRTSVREEETTGCVKLMGRA